MIPHPIRRALAPLQMVLMLGVVVLATATAVIGMALLVADRRGRLLRLATLAAVYAAVEVVVLLVLAVISVLQGLRLAGPDADLRAAGWALGTVLGASRVLCGFRVDLEEPASLGPFQQDGPVLVLARHGGIGDSFALAHLLITRYHRRPRVVLKRLLQLDPMLDVALTRMGACWVGPGAGDANRDAIGRLAGSLGAGEALLLFPEGGNWTPGRRTSALRRLWASGRHRDLKAAALMQHVLPPRTGGVFACLDAQPDVPIVVMAHAGLDRITTLRALWSALPFPVPMRLRWWPAAPPPTLEEDRARWLTTEWAVVDEWIGGARAAAGGGAGPDPAEGSGPLPAEGSGRATC